MESLDLSVQRNTGSESRNSQSYFKRSDGETKVKVSLGAPSRWREA